MAAVNVAQLEENVVARLEGLDTTGYLRAMALILRDSQNLHLSEQSHEVATSVDEAINVLNCKSGPGCTVTDAEITRLLRKIQILTADEGTAGSTGLLEELETIIGVLSELVGLAPNFYGAQTVTAIAYETFVPPAPSGISLSDPNEQLEETHPVIAKIRQYLEVVSQIEATSMADVYDPDQIFAAVFQPFN
jgi:hypothetical protein